jgi:hypothetical protein
MPSYMLLLYEDPKLFAGLSPAEMQAVIEKYSAWGKGLRKKKVLVGSDKLRDGDGRVLTQKKGKLRVLDGPYSETKEVLGGYFTVRAESYDEAQRLAESCPHLEYGGRIEIRQVDEVH